MSDDRFTKGLNIGQRLAHVVEECGEVLAAAGKCQRWGFYSVNPLLQKQDQVQNIDWLKQELADLKSAIDRFEVDFENIHDGYKGGASDMSLKPYGYSKTADD